MQTHFFVSQNGEERGPLTVVEVLELLKTGDLVEHDYIYVEEKADWILLHDFKLELGQATPQEAPQIAPQSALPAKAPEALVEKPNASEPEKSPSWPIHIHQLKAPVNFSTPPPSANRPLPTPPPAPGEALPVAPPPPPTRALAVVVQPPAPLATKSVQIQNGVGIIEVAHDRAERVRLLLLSKEKSTLPLAQKTELQIKPDRAVRLVVTGTTQTVVGQSLRVDLEAHDSFGNLDAAFALTVQIQLSGSAQGGGICSFSGGRAHFQTRNTVAEKVTLTVAGLPPGFEEPRLPEFTFIAGPATQYVIETPSESFVGQNVKVTVKALDAFGNLATTANETVELALDPLRNSS